MCCRPVVLVVVVVALLFVELMLSLLRLFSLKYVCVVCVVCVLLRAKMVRVKAFAQGRRLRSPPGPYTKALFSKFRRVIVAFAQGKPNTL